MLSVIILTAASYFSAECHYSDCRLLFLYAVCHYAVCHYSDCCILFIVVLSVIMLNVIMLNIVMLCVVNAEFRYVECHGAIYVVLLEHLKV
jgi:hypothetical protein